MARSACGHDNPPDARFCSRCGSALVARCHRCDAELAEGARFCSSCGEPAEPRARNATGSPEKTARDVPPLSAKKTARDVRPPPTADDARSFKATAPPARSPRDYTPPHLVERILRSRSTLEGERKQVTVLFADVKGSMELAEQLDPEQWHGILDRFFRILTDGVHRFEGTVNQYTGDGIMALFGAPIAHEDHAQRACYAALELQAELARYATDVKREYGIGFSTRIGLNSGEVVVGAIGDDLRMDYTAQGHTVGLAQRMEALASPDTCYLSDATAKLAAGYFDLEDLGDFAIKGTQTRVRVHRLIGGGQAHTRFDLSRARGLTRFVGRDPDVAALEAALEQTASGAGQVVGVVAEAGAGKSRLCFEFAERCRARGLRVIEGHALAHGKNLPLLPMLEIFRAYYGIEEHDPERLVREKIAGRLLLLDESFRDVLPVLFDFFGVSDPNHPPPRMDAEARQRLYFAVLRKVVQHRSPGEPEYISIIEDLHWLDAASAAFLAEWIDAIAQSGRLLIVNFRPEYHAPWMQKSYYRQIPLAPLDADAIRELLADQLGDDPSTAGLADAIHRRTAGNPFFAEEMVRALIEAGHLEGERGAYRLAVPVETIAVPASVKSLLAARIDRLPEREKDVLQTASIIGREFRADVLARVLEVEATELQESLAALKSGEFLYETEIYPVAEYCFKHPLTQEVALASQLHEKRTRNHASVARVLEDLFAGKLDDNAPLLAHHWEEAGERIVAAEWHRRAAERMRRSDVKTSHRHWDRVRMLTANHEEDPQACILAGEAYVGLLSVGFRVGLSPEEQTALYGSGKTWIDRIDDVDLAIRFEAAASAIAITSGDCERALVHARAAEELVAGTEDETKRHSALWLSTYVWDQLGELALSCERFDRMIAYGREHGDLPSNFGGDDLLPLAIQLRASLEAEIGDLAHACELVDEAVRVARTRELLESEGWALTAYSTIEWIDGDVARALPPCRRGLEIAEKLGSAFSRAWAFSTLATVLAHAADPAAVTAGETAVALAREHNTALEGEAAHLAALAQALTCVGRHAEAVETAASAIEIAQRRKTRRWEARAALAHARALLALNGREHAARIEESLQHLERTAQRIGAPNHLGLAMLERASLAEQLGDGARRVACLRDARARFEPAHAQTRVAQIDEMLAAAG